MTSTQRDTCGVCGVGFLVPKKEIRKGCLLSVGDAVSKCVARTPIILGPEWKAITINMSEPRRDGRNLRTLLKNKMS